MELVSQPSELPGEGPAEEGLASPFGERGVGEGENGVARTAPSAGERRRAGRGRGFVFAAEDSKTGRGVRIVPGPRL